MQLKALTASGPNRQAIRSLLDRIFANACSVEERLAAQDARIRYLQSLSVTDEITGLFNRRGFDTELERTLARARRNQEQGLVVLCDLDRFKAINDTYGHPAGDQVLASIGAILRQSLRDSDIAARLGGDEFGLILIDAEPTAASQRLNPLIEALDGLFIAHESMSIPIGASLGYAAYGPNSDAQTTLTLADKALYRNKLGS